MSSGKTNLATLTAVVPAAAVAMSGGAAVASTLVITEYGGPTNTVLKNSSLEFDLDGDGSDDFALFSSGNFAEIYSFGEGAGNDILRDTDGTKFAIALEEGGQVSGVLAKGTGFSDKANLFEDNDGPLPNVGDTMYVGLRLNSNGISYGWAELERGSLILLRTGYMPGGAAAPIPSPVPVPPGLALLATGALGLAALRRARRKPA